MWAFTIPLPRHRGLVTQATHRFWDHDWTNATGNVWEDNSSNPLGNAFDLATPSAVRDDVSLAFLTLTHLGTSGLTDVVFTTTYDAAFQDLNYAYDPAGNPVQVRDATINPSFASNQVIPNTRTFFYDPRHRLVRAQGRKLKTVVPGSQNPLETSPAEGDYEAYDLRYAYEGRR